MTNFWFLDDCPNCTGKPWACGRWPRTMSDCKCAYCIEANKALADWEAQLAPAS